MGNNERKLKRSERKALDCWTHGVAHLVAEFGQKEALNLMAPVVMHLLDRTQLEEEPQTSSASDDAA